VKGEVKRSEAEAKATSDATTTARLQFLRFFFVVILV